MMPQPFMPSVGPSMQMQMGMGMGGLPMMQPGQEMPMMGQPGMQQMGMIPKIIV